MTSNRISHVEKIRCGIPSKESALQHGCFTFVRMTLPIYPKTIFYCYFQVSLQDHKTFFSAHCTLKGIIIRIFYVPKKYNVKVILWHKL